MLTWRKNGNRQICYCETEVGGKVFESMMEKVGMVKPTNDGRYTYVLFTSKYSDKVLAEEVTQGVTKNEETAKFLVESNYSPH